MASILKVDTIQDQAGNNIISEAANVITIGASGDTISASKLQVTSASSGGTPHASADELVVENSANSGINILSGASNEGAIYFGDSSDNDVGRFRYNHADNSMHFFTNASEAMRIDSSGNVGIGTSNPSHNLTVDGGTSSNIALIKDATGSATVRYYDGGSQKAYIQLTSSEDMDFFAASGVDQIFYGNGAEVMRLSSGAVFNEGSGDRDFRVESNNNTHMLFVDGGNDKIGIGTNSPSSFGSLATDLVIGTTSGEHGLTIVTGTGNSARMQFSDNTSSPFRGAIEYSHGSDELMFYTDGSQKMKIDSSGKVGIGTTTLTYALNISESTGNMRIKTTDGQNVANASTSILEYHGTDNRAGYVGFVGGDMVIHTDTYSAGDIKLNTNGSERMRITSGGTVLVSNTSEPSSGDNGAQISNGSYHIFCRNTSSAVVLWAFGSAGELRILGNGNAQNTNNSYGAISDRVLKENEVDASSQWNDIKALQIKHYNFKSTPNEKQLGVIAQDLEASGMNGLVENNQDELYTEDDVLPEGKNIGDVKLKNYKSVKYSILYMKSVKALQEAMERIETLEAKVTALETTTP